MFPDFGKMANIGVQIESFIQQSLAILNAMQESQKKIQEQNEQIIIQNAQILEHLKGQ